MQSGAFNKEKSLIMKKFQITSPSKLTHFWIVIGFGLFFLLITLVAGDSFFGQSTSNHTENAFSIFSNINSSLYDKSSFFEVDLEVEPPSISNTNRPKIKIQRLSYFIKESGAPEFNKICINAIDVLENLRGNVRSFNFFSGNFPACYDITKADMTMKSPHGTILGYYLRPPENAQSDISSPNIFWYPYDSYRVEITTILEYTLFKDSSIVTTTTISPLTVGGASETSEWDTSLDVVQDFSLDNPLGFGWAGVDMEQVENFSALSVNFSRPILYVVVYPIALLAMLFFIGMLTFVDSLDNFLQGAVAVLFGIFGLRETLIPSNIGTRTIIDIFSIGFYLCFAIVLIQFASKILAKRQQEKK